MSLVTLDFGDLPDHDISWFNIVNDLIFVLEHAKDLPVPIREAEETAVVIRFYVNWVGTMSGITHREWEDK